MALNAYIAELHARALEKHKELVLEQALIHLFAYPFGYLRVPGLGGKVEYAQFLHDGSEVRFTDGTDCFFLTDDPEATKDLVFYVPNVKPHTLVPVIEIFLKD